MTGNKTDGVQFGIKVILTDEDEYDSFYQPSKTDSFVLADWYLDIEKDDWKRFASSQVGNLTIDLGGHSVSRANQPVELTPTEFAILVALANQPKRVLSRMQIMEQALGESFEGYERTIDAHVKNLRNKLEPEPKKPRYIHTVFGVGYKFEAREDGAQNE